MFLLRLFSILLMLLCGIFIVLVVGVRSFQSSYATPELIEPGLYQIKLGYVYAYAARTERGILLFDTGGDPLGQGLAVLVAAAAKSSPVKEVTDIFLTHGHPDHTAGANLFHQANIWLGKDDVALATQQISKLNWMERFLIFLMHIPAIQVEHTLVGEEIIHIEGKKLVHSFPMPGHTNGSYAFLYDEVLFIGDNINCEQNHLQPMSRFLQTNLAQNWASIEHLHQRTLFLPLRRICTMHGGCTKASAAHTEFDNFILQHRPGKS